MSKRKESGQIVVLFYKGVDHARVLRELDLRQSCFYSMKWGTLVDVLVPKGSEEEWIARFRGRDDVVGADFYDGPGLS